MNRYIIPGAYAVSLTLFFKKKRALLLQRKLNKAAYNRYKQSESIPYKKAAARIICFAAAEILLLLIIYII